jgi:quercetin dioxygenase-like cupin family protein
MAVCNHKNKRMKKVLYLMMLFAVAFFSKAAAQDNAVFPKGEISAADNHTGTVWLKELNVPDSIANFSLAQATFAAGAKLDWHIHPGGQYLLITEGTGFYQERGKPVQIIRKGEVIKCLPGIEHWHGATPQTSLAYIGATPVQNGKTVWLKRVTDEEYKSVNFIPANEADKIKELSKQKWQWMADKNTDSLNTLFDDRSIFVHMGGSWGKTQELNTIKDGGIWYKKAAVYAVSVNIIGNTAILLNDIDLLAVVGGNEVIHSFMVTEVYIKENGKWKLGSLTFSQLLRPVKMTK